MSSCNDIALTNPLACYYAYPKCTSREGTSCSPSLIKELECSDFMTAERCNGDVTLGGLCYWTSNETCAVVTHALNYQYPTVFPATGTSPAYCAASTCASFRPLDHECMYVSSISFTDDSVTACMLTTTHPIVCVDAPSTSVLNTPHLCIRNTYNTYAWSSNDPTNGSCILCSGDSIAKDSAQTHIKAIFVILALVLQFV